MDRHNGLHLISHAYLNNREYWVRYEDAKAEKNVVIEAYNNRLKDIRILESRITALREALDYYADGVTPQGRVAEDARKADDEAAK